MSTIDEKETRTDRTANSELDSLIEEAVIENCARKRLHSLENEIRDRERKSRTLRRIFLWAGGAVSAAAVISAVVILHEGNGFDGTKKDVYARVEADATEPGTADTPEGRSEAGMTEPRNGETRQTELQKRGTRQTETRNGETPSARPTEEPGRTPALSVEDKAKIIGGDCLACLDVHRGVGEIDRRVQTALRLLKEEKTAEAIDSLETARDGILHRRAALDAEEDDNDFAELVELNGLECDVEWYLAIAYLNTGDIEKAGTKMKEIAAGGSRHKEDAKKILDELRKL